MTGPRRREDFDVLIQLRAVHSVMRNADEISEIDNLFYRLNVFPIAVPSLPERGEDIPLLVEYFVARFAKGTGKKIRKISKRTLEQLSAYHWPGNIRELQWKERLVRDRHRSTPARLTGQPPPRNAGERSAYQRALSI